MSCRRSSAVDFLDLQCAVSDPAGFDECVRLHKGLGAMTEKLNNVRDGVGHGNY